MIFSISKKGSFVKKIGTEYILLIFNHQYDRTVVLDPIFSKKKITSYFLSFFKDPVLGHLCIKKTNLFSIERA